VFRLGLWQYITLYIIGCVPKLFDRLKYESEMKTIEEQGVGPHSLACNTLGVEGHARASGWD
jgi:hypothetical protein